MTELEKELMQRCHDKDAAQLHMTKLVDELVATLKDANSVCRSAHAVADRIVTHYGYVYAGTSFGFLKERLYESLERQLVVLNKHGAFQRSIQEAEARAGA